VWNGQKLSLSEAEQRAAQVGWDKFPSYITPEQADLRYAAMHDFLDQDTQAYNSYRR
jgi:hypothetical protein